MSTVLGTLIFIGILFSAVVPMFLVMQQADIILDQEKLDIRRVDDERSRELMDFYAYPITGEDKIELKVNSRFELPIQIVHLWINNTLTPVDFEIPPMQQDVILGQYAVPVHSGANSTFKVKVTTDRGNVYESKTGEIMYDETEGWMAPELQVIVFVGSQGSSWWNQWGNYKAKLTRTATGYSCEQTKSWTFGTCMFQFDPSGTPPDPTLTGSGPGTYHLTVYRKSFWGGSWTIIREMDVTITWPLGSPIVEVYI
jgi:hypothetical protein